MTNPYVPFGCCGCCGDAMPRASPNQKWGTCQGCIDAGCSGVPGSDGDQLRGANCRALVKIREAIREVVATATRIRSPELTRITEETTLGQLAIQKMVLGVKRITIERDYWDFLDRGALRVSLHASDVGVTYGYGDELHDALDQAFEKLRATMAISAVSPSR